MPSKPLYCLICLLYAFYFVPLVSNEDPIAFDLEQNEQFQEEPAKLELISEDNGWIPGQPIIIAIRMEIEEGWHSYWKNPGETGMPLGLEWELPEGFTVSELRWPYPSRFEQGGLLGFGYEHEVVFLAELMPPLSSSLNEVSIQAAVRSLVCSDAMCLPVDSELSLKIPRLQNGQSQQKTTEHIPLFEKARTHVPQHSEEMQAKWKDEFIKLSLPPDVEASAYDKISFFPLAKGMIETAQDPIIASADEPSRSSAILLKGNPLSEEESLKGVLVLQKGAEAKAWDVDLPLQKKAAVTASTDSDFEGGIGLAFLFAFLGGLLLNLMPCVLPVISLKILSFVKMAGQNRSATLQHGFAFFTGVIVSFWILAGAMLLLQAYGHAIGWGFQLQEPLFVGLLAALLFLFGLSFFGIFEFGTSVTAIAGQVQQNRRSRNGALMGSFLSGMLATAVATPCSGPFLGSAIGYAVTLPPILAIAMFTVLGAGMALPYLIFAIFPSLMRFLPKPGPWMVTFKELMGFVMFATVLWLLWVFAAQTGDLSLFVLLFAFLMLSLAAWIYGRYCTPMRSSPSRRIAGFMVVLIGLTSFYGIFKASLDTNLTSAPDVAIAMADEWEPFSPERVEQLKQEGTHVVIDFTAKWCLICQTNKLVLTSPSVSDKMSELKVVKMKADWTKRDPVITEALRKFGRNGVPLYVVISGDPETSTQILPQLLTPEVVLDALNQL